MKSTTTCTSDQGLILRNSVQVFERVDLWNIFIRHKIFVELSAHGSWYCGTTICIKVANIFCCTIRSLVEDALEWTMMLFATSLPVSVACVDARTGLQILLCLLNCWHNN